MRSFNNDKKQHITFDHHGFRRADVIMLVKRHTHTQLQHTRHIQLDGYSTGFSSQEVIKSKKKNLKKAFFSILTNNATQSLETSN